MEKMNVVSFFKNTESKYLELKSVVEFFIQKINNGLIVNDIEHLKEIVLCTPEFVNFIDCGIKNYKDILSYEPYGDELVTLDSDLADIIVTYIVQEKKYY